MMKRHLPYSMIVMSAVMLLFFCGCGPTYLSGTGTWGLLANKAQTYDIGISSGDKHEVRWATPVETWATESYCRVNMIYVASSPIDDMVCITGENEAWIGHAGNGQMVARKSVKGAKQIYNAWFSDDGKSIVALALFYEASEDRPVKYIIQKSRIVLWTGDNWQDTYEMDVNGCSAWVGFYAENNRKIMLATLQTMEKRSRHNINKLYEWYAVDMASKTMAELDKPQEVRLTPRSAAMSTLVRVYDNGKDRGEWDAPLPVKLETVREHGGHAYDEYFIRMASFCSVSADSGMGAMRFGMRRMGIVILGIGTRGMQGEVRVWNMRDGRLVCRIAERNWEESGGGRVGSVVLSPDGRTLAIGIIANYRVVLVDVAKGKEIGRYTGDDFYPEALAITGDGKYLVSAYLNGTIKCWPLSR